MNNIIKYVTITFLVAVGGVIAYVQLFPTTKPQPTKLSIGAILPRTGDFAAFGEEIDRGARIAIEEAKQNGIDIEYISEDDHSSPAQTTDAAQKLTSIHKVGAAITATVQEVKPAAPIFNTAKTPLIAVWDSNEAIKTAGPYIFTTGFGTEAAAKRMAEFAIRKNIQTLAVVSQKDDWSSLISQSFVVEFTKLGGKVVLIEETTATQRDFRAMLSKVKASNARGIYAPLLPQAGGTFIKQARELGITAPIMMGDSFSSDDIAIAKEAAEGTYFTNLYADDTTSLATKYEAVYGSKPNMDVFVSFGYDAINTIIAAHKIAQAKNISIRDALLQTRIQGTGTDIAFNGTQYSERLEKIYIVVQGKFVEVQ